MKTFLAVLLCAVGLSAMAAGPYGFLPTYQTNQINIASTLAVVSNTTATATTGTAFQIPQGVPLVLEASLNGANTGTSNIVYGFNFSTDGTHYTTTLPFTITTAANGSTAVIGHTNVAASVFAGVQYMRLDSIASTQTNNVTNSAIYVGWWQ